MGTWGLVLPSPTSSRSGVRYAARAQGLRGCRSAQSLTITITAEMSTQITMMICMMRKKGDTARMMPGD